MAERRSRRTRTVEVSSDRGVFMISVAAELAEMHPQTLRMYETRGLIEPKRSPKGTRLYSQEDVERLRRIQEMTAELGMNLAGVERVFELEIEGATPPQEHETAEPPVQVPAPPQPPAPKRRDEFGDRLADRIKAIVERSVERSLERAASQVDTLAERASKRPETITERLEED